MLELELGQENRTHWKVGVGQENRIHRMEGVGQVNHIPRMEVVGQELLKTIEQCIRHCW